MWNAARNVPLNPAIPSGKNSTCSLMYVLHCSIIYNVLSILNVLVYLWVFCLEVLRKHIKNVGFLLCYVRSQYESCKYCFLFMALVIYPNFVSSTNLVSFLFAVSIVDVLTKPEPNGIELETSCQSDINFLIHIL